MADVCKITSAIQLWQQHPAGNAMLHELSDRHRELALNATGYDKNECPTFCHVLIKASKEGFKLWVAEILSLAPATVVERDLTVFSVRSGLRIRFSYLRSTISS